MPQLFPTDPSQATVAAGGSRAPAAFPKSWKFDFDRGEFVTDQAGRVGAADGDEAYRQWAIKAVLTARYRHPIYGRQFGTEAEDLLRQNLAPSVLESELVRTITEALLVDPRTQRVGDFSFARSGAGLEVSFTITTARGDAVPLTVPIGG